MSGTIPDGFVSAHIPESEYRCSCCGALPPDYAPGAPIFLDLFIAFEALRELRGRPIVINSGYRCPEHNFEIDGATLSAHLFGCALDLKCDSADDVRVMRDLARSVSHSIRIGWQRYLAQRNWIIHIDTAYEISPRPSSHFRPGVEW